jgi:cyclic pyranopterin phosphate synthase
MVDVSTKRSTNRKARAEATVVVGASVARLLRSTGGVAKGNVLETARIAGILAAKRTHEWIPLCHPLPIDHIEVDAKLVGGDRVRVETVVTCRAPTGVEMEALTAAAAAALTVYDMCKSASKGITIESIRLLEKKGGKSGDWKRGASRAR